MATEVIDRAATLAWLGGMTAEAADMATAMLKRGMSIQQKADGTVVTDIDRAVERYVRDAIAARFPGHAILGEEFGHEDKGDAPLWAIDPIDGTTNLANGLPLWGVSIGLIEGDAPTVGCLSFPLLGETYAAASGLGATRNGEPLLPLPSGGETGWEDTYGICSSSVRQVDFSRLSARLRVLGSAALEVCWVAAGKLHGCQNIGVSLYDVAAGLCVAHETGARVRWLRGGVYSPRAHAATGPRPDDVLLIAPQATLDHLAARLS